MHDQEIDYSSINAVYGRYGMDYDLTFSVGGRCLW